MLHDYHLYTAPAHDPRGAAGRLPPPLRPHPLVAARQPGGSSPGACARRSSAACSPTTSSASTPAPTASTSSRCCDELLELEVDYERCAVDRTRAARPGCAPTRSRSTPSGCARAAESAEVAEYEREVLERRREHLIIRVDRADLSKNVLRGFTAFDIFLDPAPRVPREGHLHRPPAALAPGRARVRRVPGADRGAGRGRQPPPRHHRLDADRPADLRELPRGGRPLQALRPADGQLDLRRHEPGRQGGAGGQHPRRRR